MRPFAVVVFCLASTAAAQQPPAGTVVPPGTPSAVTPAAPPQRARPFHLELGTFYSSLSRGYGQWRGYDARLLWTLPRATPIFLISTQTHGGNSQLNFGIGSYITINEQFYAIVGASHAPDRGVVLYPKTRLDAALLGSVPAVPGLVLSAGVTDIYGTTEGSGGTIASVGSLYYRGRFISSGVVRFNRDRQSGAHSRSEQIGTQFGEQGRYWVGGSFTHGTEAYQLTGAAPVDVWFEGVGASAFVQRWLGRNHGFTVRYDYEHKYTAFVRSGVALIWFFDF